MKWIVTQAMDDKSFHYDFSAIKPSIINLKESFDKAEAGLAIAKAWQAKADAIGDDCCRDLERVARGR